MPEASYVLDSTAVIDLCLHFRTAAIRRKLLLAQESCLKIPEGVARELKRKSDNANRIVKALVAQCPDSLVQIARVPNLGEETARIERLHGEKIRVGTRQYAGFWSTAHGKKAVDGQVVGTAKKLKCTLVSDDGAVRLACMLENVPCIGWSEFARVVGLFTQLSLFGEAGKT